VTRAELLSKLREFVFAAETHPGEQVSCRLQTDDFDVHLEVTPDGEVYVVVSEVPVPYAGRQGPP
jgi:hypothetical protein